MHRQGMSLSVSRRFGDGDRPAAGDAPGDSIRRLLDRVVDASLLGLLLVAPLFMGGRHPLGKFVFIALAAVAATAWCASRCFSRKNVSPFPRSFWLLAAGLGLLLLQTIPLSESVLARLSPHIAELLPLWNNSTRETSLGDWPYLSLAPQATRSGMTLYLAFAAVLIVVYQRCRTLEHIERWMRFLALAGATMAVLGLFQYLVSNGKFCWIYQDPWRDTRPCVRGPFINENHYAHFLALCVGPLVWWFFRCFEAMESDSRSTFFGESRSGSVFMPTSPVARRFGCYLLGGALVLILLCSALTYSRGGVLIVAGALVWCLIGYRRRLRRNRFLIVSMTATGIVLVAAVMFHGYRQLSGQLESLSSADSLQSRVELWKTHQKIVRDFPLLGTGVGSHVDIVPIYFEGDMWGREFTHGESGYFHLLVETGIAGLLLVLAALAVVVFWGVRAARHGPSPRHAACLVALSASMAASVLHSLGDFVWFIPACLTLTVMQAALMARLGKTTGSTEEEPAPAEPPRATSPYGRVAWAGAALTVALVSVVVLPDRYADGIAALHWDRYLIDNEAFEHLDPSSDEAIALNDRMSARLIEVLRIQPNHPEANLRMAKVCLRQFATAQEHSDNAMPLDQIRDAALESRFASQEALDDWLSRALGENRQYLDLILYYTRRGLPLCPLQGDGYLYYAQVGFIDARHWPSKSELVDQALRVSPHNGSVLLAAGREMLLIQDHERWFAFWKKAFRTDRDTQTHILDCMSNLLTADQLLQAFEPDLEGLAKIYAYYRKHDMRDKASVAGRAYARQLVRQADQARDEQQAAEAWRKAARVLYAEGDPAGAFECVQKALRYRADDYDLRLQLARILFAQEKYAEAAEQYRWCLGVQPNDRQLKNQLVLSLQKANARAAASHAARTYSAAAPTR